MSENVELLRRSFEAMGAWDVGELLRLYAPDVEFLPLTGTLVETGGYRSHEGVRTYFAEARPLWDVLEPEGPRLQGSRRSGRGGRSLPGAWPGQRSGEPSGVRLGGRRARRHGRLSSTCATYDEALRVAGVQPAEDHAR